MADHEALWLEMGTVLESAREPDPDADPNAEPRLKGQTEFAMWMHNPITAAFFAFLGDQETNFTEALTELFIRGAIDERETAEARNPHVWRGRILSLRDLQRITLGEIAGFYRQKRGIDV